MAGNDFREDLYEILGLEPAANERLVARAYKKKSILHHPDRGGNVQKFLELTHARDILLDPKKKETYDKKLSRDLLIQKKQREREAQLDDKRRQMRDELLQKEQKYEHSRKSTARQQKVELSRYREKALARQQELQARVAREAKLRSEVRMAQQDVLHAPKSQRTVAFKWDKKFFSHSDDTLTRELRTYGSIESIRIKTSSAKVVFTEALAAANAVRIEGHKICWREVSIQGHIVETEELFSLKDTILKTPVKHEVPTLPVDPISLEKHLAFEKEVLAFLRETAKLQQEQERQTPVPLH
ncbi:hypothetical protein CCR75_004190 [Bremia lactucae]|uniref:J domain-containing protein n=1 Tax=Bremia lactucae TaxID=4779 RepID=A0A976FJZ9_BRELC|nr:hypothetical protein CCR75_004190 [Bremia lactucae]